MELMSVTAIGKGSGLQSEQGQTAIGTGSNEGNGGNANVALDVTFSICHFWGVGVV